jgi:RecJ-like exonuclease
MIKISLSGPADQMKKLIDAFNRGDLDGLGVVSLDVPCMMCNGKGCIESTYADTTEIELVTCNVCGGDCRFTYERE